VCETKTMNRKLTFNNQVLIKLEPENTSIKLRNGFELYVDNTYEPEKNATVTGMVYGLPSHLYYTGKGNVGMPWDTPMELKMGDKVIVYYLSIINAFKPENRRYVLEGEDRYVFIQYSSIYAKYGEGFVQPINGYCLIEPCSDPFVEKQKQRMQSIGMELILFNKKNNTNVSFGIVRYLSTPNRRYVDEHSSDEGVDIAIGDTVVLKKTYDLPLQYDLHQKVDKGKKLLRVQRRSILAKI